MEDYMEKNEFLMKEAAGRGIKQYINNGIMTRPPELLTLDLYDGALRFLNGALEGFDIESYEKINNNLNRAAAIIDELMMSLNFEKGGEIAKNLNSLYIFIRECITKANLKKDRKKVEDAIRITMILRDAWSEGVVKNRV
jgi:flagellar protein FliS